MNAVKGNKGLKGSQKEESENKRQVQNELNLEIIWSSINHIL